MSKLNPGSTERRWDPPGGVKKHNEKIHRESKFVDDNKNLPFEFSKPYKHKKSKTVKCLNCGYITSVPINTVGMVCHECKKYSSVEEVFYG